MSFGQLDGEFLRHILQIHNQFAIICICTPTMLCILLNENTCTSGRYAGNQTQLQDVDRLMSLWNFMLLPLHSNSVFKDVVDPCFYTSSLPQKSADNETACTAGKSRVNELELKKKSLYLSRMFALCSAGLPTNTNKFLFTACTYMAASELL